MRVKKTISIVLTDFLPNKKNRNEWIPWNSRSVEVYWHAQKKDYTFKPDLHKPYLSSDLIDGKAISEPWKQKKKHIQKSYESVHVWLILRRNYKTI